LRHVDSHRMTDAYVRLLWTWTGIPCPGYLDTYDTYIRDNCFFIPILHLTSLLV
jgi:hypothetical protein